MHNAIKAALLACAITLASSLFVYVVKTYPLVLMGVFLLLLFFAATFTIYVVFFNQDFSR